MIVLSRGLVHVATWSGKCEACSNVRAGLMLTGAADCGMVLCAHCIADTMLASLHPLAHEFVKWGTR